jgi:hypothetical protein
MPSGHEPLPDDDGLAWTWKEVVKLILKAAAFGAAGYAFLVLAG